MKKILIIEDDRVIANVYRNKLSVEGFHVEVASDGLAGLEAVRNFRPDAVLLDLMLPKLTGVEWMKQIRSERDFQQLPVIVFSNTYLTSMVEEAWKSGATKCLSKANYTPQQVLAVVRNTLRINGDAATKPAAGAAPPVAESSPAQKSEVAFQAELRKSFVAGLPATLAALRTSLQGMIHTENDMGRLRLVDEMYRRIHSVTGNAAITGLVQIAKMADALEALLKELYEEPRNINVSTLRTVASAIDFLGILFGEESFSETRFSPGNVLVVDDETISRQAITYALDKAGLKSVNIEDPVPALKLLMDSRFDLIFLDVDMPQMNGYELCSKLRSLPAYKKTPVVFVTVLNDFENRANSSMSGGNDFIAKPFLFVELSVKALMYVLRGRLEAMKAVRPQWPNAVKV
jgi:DNA-binding response OmpR family regulator